MDHGEDLSLSPSILSDVEPVQAISDEGAPSRSQPLKGHGQTNKHEIILATRPGSGKRGDAITLLCNHFAVKFSGTDEYFYQYSLLVKDKDDSPIVGKEILQEVIDKMKQTYHSELGDKDFAYDGERALFTLGHLPQNEFAFDVQLDNFLSGRMGSPGGSSGGDNPEGSDRKRLRKSYSRTKCKVKLKFATKIPLSAITQAMKGHDSENAQGVFRVLDILRQHSAAQYAQTFFWL
ncbi:Argonaute family protein [Rhynchospora pubera]|uniref:Argonaute family protein n=1 Tax=Rhynchospora pubera TaxID=906938 RepID=A0AAV8DR04_9POAL|nr:Argonaute family protein [Rhynchospora pubera]